MISCVESSFSIENHERFGKTCFLPTSKLKHAILPCFFGGSPCFAWNGKLPAFSHVQGREELQKMLEDYSKHRYKSDTQPSEEDKHGTRRDFKMFTEK